jgi:hypothetical protein
MTDKNIWYLPGPFHRYEEDIKAIAKKAGLRIIDANVTESRDGECEKPPKVTLKELPPVPVIVPPQSESETELQDLIAGLNAERDGLRGLIESLEGVSPLEHPGAGELPIRLFDALSSIHQGIAGVKAERDDLQCILRMVDTLAESVENRILDLPSGDGVALRIHQAVTELWVDLEREVKAREAATEEAEALRKEVAELKQAATERAEKTAKAKP